jgi:methyl-accepting chemotaxis protein
MEGMGSEAEASGREFETLNQQQAPASARLAAVARFANSLDGHATALEELTSKFAKEMDDIDGSINGLLEFLSESPTSWPDDAEEFLSSVSEMAATARIAMESAGQFASSTRDLGRLSRALRRPSERVYRAFMLMSDKIRLMDHWESSVIRLRRAREAALRYAEADTSSAQEPTA